MRISIAIDGPSGSGKSSIAYLLSKKLDFMYINTGLIYRAITFYSMKENLEAKDCGIVLERMSKNKIKFIDGNIIIDDINLTDELRSPEINKNVAGFAKCYDVRKFATEISVNLSKEHDVILDGRDIGTVVLKDATFKFFLDASLEERARRRFDELKGKYEISYEDVLNSIRDRDFVDSSREISPITIAKDAIFIDTTHLNIEEVLTLLYNVIIKR